MAERFPYCCSWATKELRTLHDTLWRHELLANQPYPDMVAQTIQLCSSCERGGRARRCRGWLLTIAPTTPLVFKAAKVRGRLVRPELQVLADFRRTTSETGVLWKDRPVGRLNVTVEMYSVNDEQLLARHHADLSDPMQDGPVWHLQFGGNPSGEERLPDSWLSVPRWPAAPGEAVLACDLIAYSFHYPRWLELQTDGGWVRLVQRAEDLMMTQYLERLKAHFSAQAHDRQSTWLAAQDNKGGAWDPRPR